MFKVNNRNTTTKCEICSKLTIKCSGVFIVNFEHISQIVSNVNFEQVNVGYAVYFITFASIVQVASFQGNFLFLYPLFERVQKWNIGMK